MGGLTISENAKGGTGGTSDQAGGDGGAATISQAGTFTTDQEIVDNVIATGGAGGSGASGGDGGTANVSVDDVFSAVGSRASLRVFGVSISATGGGAGIPPSAEGAGGRSGDATASGVITTTGGIGPIIDNVTATSGAVNPNGQGTSGNATAVATVDGRLTEGASEAQAIAVAPVNSGIPSQNGSANATTTSLADENQAATARAVAVGGTGSASAYASSSDPLLASETATASGSATSGASAYARTGGPLANLPYLSSDDSYVNVDRNLNPLGWRALGDAQVGGKNISATEEFTLDVRADQVSQSNSLGLYLTTPVASSTSFGELHFDLVEQGQTIVDQTFTDLGQANAFFTDDTLNLGALAPATDGVIDITVDLSQTLSAGQSYGINLFLGAVPCFARGTCLQTQRGWIAVEDLKVGDRLVTLAESDQPIVWIGSRVVDCRRHPKAASVYPVRVAAHAFGFERPKRTIFLSPDHAVFFDGVLIPIKYLANDTSITQIPMGHVEYFHVELERHSIVLAEGLPVESYLDTGDRSSFMQHEPMTLHPSWDKEFADAALIYETLAVAPLRTTGIEVENARSYLKTQAQSQRPATAS